MEYKEERLRLINSLKYQGLSQEILDAMYRVPRHLFVPSESQIDAYVDAPIMIGQNQTISAPHMVAMMCDLLDLSEGQVVLEVGAGSGYHAAVISELVGESGHVYSIECIEELVNFSRNNLKNAGYSNVTVIHGDGSEGYPEYAPYDRILVTAGAPDVPDSLLNHLKPEGILVIPVGFYFQDLYQIKKELDGSISKNEKGGVMFVPLIGKYGFNMKS
ncbi:protein-L-isoaspartate O-methyltransferase [Methanohalobium evestigatum Z-7303]|uniref:Protein-L-isoaspartate O-methyltransferase n=1 Tax=Methanohalobium evestigatum (strain ATCC BAA-1072 / DSM 3721 / NBRC 107634 / OCM 161 / Z-7303) TaxID=644295 RepID=D7EBC2_METEZ|nr:protein-L-isoaspartate O-methyltransferase [Methanohalobium evestigatum]ADI74639.1 protein-L-isoaspartate O-methyltransferase [Methanohalobium evestigatum Z-7303]